MKTIRAYAALLIVTLSLSACAQEKLALEGLDPIRLIQGAKEKGKQELWASHGRFKYHFVSEDTRTHFLKDPAKHSIQLNGKCVMSDGMEGSHKLYAVVKGRIYLGGTEGCIGYFANVPDNLVDTDTGMRRPPREVAPQDDPRPKVAILVFPGVQIIDYAGPMEVFGQGGTRPFLVGETTDVIRTAMGMQVKPEYTFENCPKAEVLVVPGGNVQEDNEKILGWIRRAEKDAQYVLSVCNGAFYLARAGLLEGKSATTFYGLIDALSEAAPNTKVVKDQRYVDNGKIITTAGLSSGIDGSLYVISKLRGFGHAQSVALNMEYDWKPDSRYARASFADEPLRRLGGFAFPDQGASVRNWTVVRQAGDATWWQKDWTFETDLTADQVQQVVDGKLSSAWKSAAKNGANGTRTGDWTFEFEGKPWRVRSTLKETAKGKFELSVRLERG